MAMVQDGFQLALCLPRIVLHCLVSFWEIWTITLSTSVLSAEPLRFYLTVDVAARLCRSNSRRTILDSTRYTRDCTSGIQKLLCDQEGRRILSTSTHSADYQSARHLSSFI